MMNLAPQPPTGFLTTNKPLPYAQHIFGTKGDKTNNADIRRYTERLGPIAHMGQVHGNRVMHVGTSGISDDCDAIFTHAPDVWLAVKTADCAPILMSSPHAVAAVHAGWRGLENGIIEATIDTLCEHFDMTPDDIHVALGPCISQPHYEVDARFGDIFPPRFMHASDNDDKLMLDIAGIVRHQTLKAGVLDIHFHDIRRCTYADAATFHSHRRSTHEGNPAACGRQLSLVKRLVE